MSANPKERSQLAAVEPDVTAVEAAKEPVGEAGDALISGPVGDHQAAASAEDTSHLGECALGMGVVVEGGRAEDGGEGAIRERQPLAVADHELGAGHSCREFPGVRHHPLREVETDGPRGGPGSLSHRGARAAAPTSRKRSPVPRESARKASCCGWALRRERRSRS